MNDSQGAPGRSVVRSPTGFPAGMMQVDRVPRTGGWPCRLSGWFWSTFPRGAPDRRMARAVCPGGSGVRSPAGCPGQAADRAVCPGGLGNLSSELRKRRSEKKEVGMSEHGLSARPVPASDLP